MKMFCFTVRVHLMLLNYKLKNGYDDGFHVVFLPPKSKSILLHPLLKNAATASSHPVNNPQTRSMRLCTFPSCTARSHATHPSLKTFSQNDTLSLLQVIQVLSCSGSLTIRVECYSPTLQTCLAPYYPSDVTLNVTSETCPNQSI